MKTNADSNVRHKYNTNIMKIKLINKEKMNKKNLVFGEKVIDALNPSAIWAYYSIGIQCIKMAKNQVLRDITHR